MFDMEDKWPGVPSSSPPSSPTAYNDSSPASSPGPDDSIAFPDDDSEAQPHGSPPAHPFAASAKGSWVPPEYEKGGKKNRRMSPSSPTTRSRNKKPRLLGPEPSLETLYTPSPRTSIFLTAAQKEMVVWDTAISRVVDYGNGAINLENSNLSTIPTQAVLDLHKFYVPEEKVVREIVPLGPPSPPRPRQLARFSSAPAVLGSTLLGLEQSSIQLFLAGNQISRVPTPLLYLERLKVLSLRNNRLKRLPPEVRNLRALHTLNISGNQLEYLPAELLEMSLRALHVFPNPFIKPAENPSVKRQPRRTESAQGRVALSAPVRTPGRVPSLVELSFRLLFSAESGPPSAAHDKRRLAQYYELPLDRGAPTAIPSHLRCVFHAVHPGSVCEDAELQSTDDEPSFGPCPSPRHNTPSMFVNPAEERFTWERVVAGVAVGGDVPLKWRGCQWGCLDFLSDGMETAGAEVTTMEVDDQNGEIAVVAFLERGLNFEMGH